MRITSKGQVTIPAEIRERTGLLPNTEVEFEVSGEKVILQKVPGKRKPVKDLIRAMQGKGTGDMSTDEIMALFRGE